MRRASVIGLVVGLAASVASVASPASAHNIGDEGCTPGYWKNHTNSWTEGLDGKGPIDPNMTFSDVYTTDNGVDHPGFVVTSEYANDSFLTALSYKGGPGTSGAEQILMRAAVAAWLNAANEGVGYPMRRWSAPGNIVKTVNDAIASNDRDTMIAVAAMLDDLNNSGCPLN
jgi:hypothetical protein